MLFQNGLSQKTQFIRRHQNVGTPAYNGKGRNVNPGYATLSLRTTIPVRVVSIATFLVDTAGGKEGHLPDLNRFGKTRVL